uniref:PH domain-containing protein n=1 Tax=Glossina pallidipes TaxID=7398 RepID=A0A1A9ZRS9_GLOPL
MSKQTSSHVAVAAAAAAAAAASGSSLSVSKNTLTVESICGGGGGGSITSGISSICSSGSGSPLPIPVIAISPGDESSESEIETEPAKIFHRRVSTKRNVGKSVAIKEGFLLKQTWSFQRWRRRYFRLKCNKLYYAKDPKVSIFMTRSLKKENQIYICARILCLRKTSLNINLNIKIYIKIKKKRIYI